MIHDSGTHRDGEPRCGWRSSAAGWWNGPSGSDATGISPRDFQNLAKTLATFVIHAFVQLASGGLPESRSISAGRGPPIPLLVVSGCCGFGEWTFASTHVSGRDAPITVLRGLGIIR